MHLGRPLLDISAIHLDPFDANIRTAQGSLVDVAKATMGERYGFNLH